MSVAHLLFFFSGAAAIGYEIVVTRLIGLQLGHEMASTLAVVAAFMGGIAVGAWAGDRPARRTAAPAQLYAFYELGIAIWAVASTLLIPWLGDRASLWIGLQPSALRHWAIVFLTVFAALLPAAAAMGATFQAMERFCSVLSADGRAVGGLYAANTAGGVVGTLAAAFFIAPLGFRGALLVFAGMSLCCAAGAALILAGAARGLPARIYSMDDRVVGRRLGITLFATGLLGIAYEVLVIRVLGQVFTNTIYTFAATLAVYLIATAVGAAAYQSLGARPDRKPGKPGKGVHPRTSGRGALASLLAALAASCAATLYLLPYATRLHDWLSASLGGGLGAVVAAEIGATAIVLLLPAALMGATFSHLVQSAPVGRGVGRALAVNTLGGTAGPPLAALGLVPWLGVKNAVAVVALGYLTLLPEATLRRTWPALLGLALVAAAPSHLGLIAAPPGGRVLVQRDGATSAVAVVEDSRGYRLLKLNDRLIEGGTHSTFGERRMAHIPLFLHPHPRRALCLGVGTGITTGAAAMHESLTITGVELVPEVLEVLPFFYPANGPAGAPGRRSPNLVLIPSDARRFVRATSDDYDVVIGDLFHPSSDGSAPLFTAEHFQEVRRHLAPGGLFCQWLPLHEMDRELVRTVVATFITVFTHADAVLAHFNAETPALGLVGFRAPATGRPEVPPYPVDWMARRVAARETSMLVESGLADELELFGCFVADRASLARFAAGAAINTDDRPQLLFAAPRAAAATGSSGARGPETLAALLAELDCDPREIIAGPDSGSTFSAANRLGAYFEARDIYLRGDIARVRGRPLEAIAAYAASARRSPDFAPGFEAALLFAEALARSHPAQVHAVLDSLSSARPSDPRPGKLLEKLTHAP